MNTKFPHPVANGTMFYERKKVYEKMLITNKGGEKCFGLGKRVMMSLSYSRASSMPDCFSNPADLEGEFGPN